EHDCPAAARGRPGERAVRGRRRRGWWRLRGRGGRGRRRRLGDALGDGTLETDEVWTTVLLLASERSASQTAEAAPAAPAITSASSAGQIQSPGYQPNRRRQPLPSRVIRPPRRGSRSPHWRQYSCPSL